MKNETKEKKAEERGTSELTRIVSWRSIEEELPPLEQFVWLYEDGTIWIGCRSNYAGEGWVWTRSYDNARWRKKLGWDMAPECDDDYRPTHWQPLPEPPNAS